MFTSYADFKGTDRLNSTTFLHSKGDSTLQFFPVQRKILKEVGRGGGGMLIQNPRIYAKRGPVPKNNIFSALRTSVWSKNRGGGGSSRAPPLHPFITEQIKPFSIPCLSLFQAPR